MAETPVTIELGGQKFLRTSDMIVRTLHSSSEAIPAGKALHDETNTDYVVPALKVFKILEVTVYCGYTVPYTAWLMDSATADVNTGTQVLFWMAPNTAGITINVDIDIATTRYLNQVGASTTKNHIIITGIEMDA